MRALVLLNSSTGFLLATDAWLRRFRSRRVGYSSLRRCALLWKEVFIQHAPGNLSYGNTKALCAISDYSLLALRHA